MIGDSWILRAGIKLVATVYSSIPIVSCIYYLFYVANRELLVNLFPGTFFASLMDTSLSAFLHYWLGFELVFHLYYLMSVSRFRKRLDPIFPPKLVREDLLNNCLNTVDNFETWVERWFLVAGNERSKFHQLCRGNIEEWLAWVFFASSIEVVSQNAEYMNEIHSIIDQVENKKKVKFPEGYNPDVKSIRLTLDPIRSIPRPFVFYVVIFLLNHMFYIILRIYGYENYGSKDGILNGYWSSTLEFDIQEETSKSSPSRISYWYRNPNSTLRKKNHQKQQPIVFIHGVGIGLCTYINFIRKLHNLERPLFLVELPHVSMRMVEDIPTMEETVREIEEMLTSKGFQKATFVGHSLGTSVCSWMIKESKKRVGACVLIDPICFLLHYPDVAYNFVYRVPLAANERATYLFGSSELCISHYFSRHFHWFQSVLFVSQRNVLPVNTHIYLSEHDNIVPSSEIYKYLTKNNVSVHIMRGLDHSSYLFYRDWEDRIVKDIRRCCNASRRSWYSYSS